MPSKTRRAFSADGTMAAVMAQTHLEEQQPVRRA